MEIDFQIKNKTKYIEPLRNLIKREQRTASHN